MPGNLCEFMLKLAEDAEARASFKLDPHAAMTKAELSHEDIAAVLSKNPKVIQKAVTKSAGIRSNSASDVTVVVIITP